MFDTLPGRARTLLTTSTHGLRQRALEGLSVLVLLARQRLADLDRAQTAHVPEPVQRFGARLWQRVIERFPALEHLTLAPEDAPVVRQHAGSNGAHAPPVAQPPTETAPEPQDLPTLLSALRGQNAETAAAAALALGDRDEASARAALLEVLDNTDGYFNPITRVAALQALARTLPREPSVDDIQPIVSRVRDLDAEVSMAAIDAVATRAPSNSAIEHLLPIVLDESGYFLPVVRDAASRALERAGLMQTTRG